jgi:hypothetical protein
MSSPNRGAASKPSERGARAGRDIAQLFRKVRLDATARGRRRCDLDPLLKEDQLEVCESEHSDCGYAACLLRVPGGGGGIMIAAGQDPGRRRFSLAHELGHYHIPSHHGVGVALYCADSDLRARASDARRLEWEANDFAAELLMPFRLFSEDVRNRDATFAVAQSLAGDTMYDVSVTAAAWRLVETTSEACALVVSVDGNIEWAVRSSAWNQPLPERHRPLPAASLAAAVTRGELSVPKGEQVDPMAWLSSADGRWVASAATQLVESTHVVTRLGQVLSLLWIPSTDT